MGEWPKIFVYDISKLSSGISEYDFDIFLLGKLSSRNFLTRFSSKNLFSDFSSLALRHLMTNSIFWPHHDSDESDFLTEKAFINLLHHIYDRFNSIQSSFRNQYWFYSLTNWPLPWNFQASWEYQTLHASSGLRLWSMVDSQLRNVPSLPWAFLHYVYFRIDYLLTHQ